MDMSPTAGLTNDIYQLQLAEVSPLKGVISGLPFKVS